MSGKAPGIVVAACGISLAIGLFFIFVWSPLPWGWKGIDLYYETALSVAKGEPFPTMHLVWGYVYFLAFWYRLFGDHPWIPLCAQALLNASIPLMMYYLVRQDFGNRVAVTTAALTGVASFNTVYTATQASDSVCTVLVVAAMLCYRLGDTRGRPSLFAAAGLAIGIAYQFRPNFAVFPLFVAAVHLLGRWRSTRALWQMAVLAATFLVAAAPWVIRNYRWSGLFVPASTHGGVQLWFGTLQSGQYEDSWIYNPRAAFEYPPLDYSSVDEFPAIVTAHAEPCDPSTARQIDLVYWTNRDRTPRRIAAFPGQAGSLVWSVPAQPSPTALYYYVESQASIGDRLAVARTPRTAPAVPAMFVITREHLGDLDVDGYVLDMFDLVRMMRHLAWGEHVDHADALDLDRDGSITERDIHIAASALVHDRDAAGSAGDVVTGVDTSDAATTLHLRDGSALTVPRIWSGRSTDLPLRTVGVGSMVAQLVSRSRPFATLQLPPGDEDAARHPCVSVDNVEVDRVPYRRLPHEMRRFTALAADNVRHDPGGYLKASIRRLLRVFIVEGSSDVRTAYQFNRADMIYAIGRALSILNVALFAIGLAIALLRGLRVRVLLLPVVYVPLTISIVLITARYSMTAQPFLFAFVALALVTIWDALGPAALTRRFRARPSPAAAR
jgi:hypothetical protein